MSQSYKVTEILSGKVLGEGVATELSHEGMRIRQSRKVFWPTPFAWLLVHLPNQAWTLRVLAEREETDQVDEFHVRFKHMFPEHRRTLEALLSDDHLIGRLLEAS